MACERGSIEWMFHMFERQCHNHIRQELDSRGFGMASHPRILLALKHHPGHTASQKELADSTGISPPTAAVSIRRMQNAGLLKRVEDKRDRRRNRITFTEKGLQAVSECQAVFERTDRALFSGFSKEEIRLLRDFYRRMIENLKSLDSHPPDSAKRSSIR